MTSKQLLEMKNIRSEIKYSLVLANNRLGTAENIKWIGDIAIKLELNIERKMLKI